MVVPPRSTSIGWPMALGDALVADGGRGAAIMMPPWAPARASAVARSRVSSTTGPPPSTAIAKAAVAMSRATGTGAEDPATPLEHAELIASRIPGARLRVLERAAHLANVERAETFIEAVLEHLGQEVPA